MKRHVTAGATPVIGCDVGAHGAGVTNRRHSFHSSAAAATPAGTTTQTAAATVSFAVEHTAPDDRFDCVPQRGFH